MKNIKTAKKLLLSFGIVVLLSVIIGAVGVTGMSTISSADNHLYKYNLISISQMGEIRDELQRQRCFTRDYALNAGDTAAIEEYKQKMSESEAAMLKFFATYENAIADASVENEYYEARKLYENEYNEFKQKILNASYSDDGTAEALIYDATFTEYVNTMINAFTASMNNNDKWAKEQVESNTGLFTRMVIIELAVLLVSVIVAFILVRYISGLISKPLGALTAFMIRASTNGDIVLSQEDIENISGFAKVKDEVGQCIGSTANFVGRLHEIEKILKAIADGDLTHELTLLSNQDTMGISLKKMMDNLNNMFSEINTATEQVSTGSRQVADGSQSLAQGSTEQAASIEELSSSMTEIAKKTKANSDMADKAATLADTIKNNAEKGNRQMSDMISAVQEINQASHNISNVIKVIDDIAFQTNILALNAAVEAARAGEAGKGFAVVAEEVRNLAAKSAEAAKNTESLIASSMEKAELGAGIANMTAESLNEIVGGINESAKIVSDIAESSKEQSSAIVQINLGIEQVARVVQQNSATAEESAAASEEMNGQSETLRKLVAQFKIR